MNNALPIGFKHWDKSDPALYIEWGLLLLIATIKNVLGIKSYIPKHEKEHIPWIIKKLEGASMAEELLANIISVLVYQLKKRSSEILHEIKLSAQLYYLRMRVQWYLMKERAMTLMKSYLSRG